MTDSSQPVENGVTEDASNESNERRAVRGDTEIVESNEVLDADADLLDDTPEDTEYIDLTHMRVKSLRDLRLKRFPQVKEACFRQNLLTSMHGLEELPEDLESLDLYDNRLEHMDRRLEHFGPAMKNLDLSFNNFRHIKHLDKFTGVQDLYLCQNDISKIQGLDFCTQVTNLELAANRIREIRGLDKLVNLEKLWLGRNKITKIEGLDKLKNLKLLSIINNRITKIEGLENCTNLEELYISFNGLETIEGLENNTKLTTLDVSNNRLTKLTGIDHLQELEELWAAYNKLEDFHNVEQQLGHLKHLHTVYFEHNPLHRNNVATYHNKVKLALGPSLEQIDANMIPKRA